MRLLRIQRKQQEHLILYLKDQRYLIERETLDGILQGKAVFTYFFYIHNVYLLTARSIESIFDMVDQEPRLFLDQCHDIKTDR